MRNPNRYGSITKLSGTRRRPYMIREGGTGKQRIIGYAASQAEAIELLARYNRQPWDISSKKTTFSELYHQWLTVKSNVLSKSTVIGAALGYRHSAELYEQVYSKLRTVDFQRAVDHCPIGHAGKVKLRTLWSHLDSFALENDIIDRGYSSFVIVPPQEEKKERTIWTVDEINKV